MALENRKYQHENSILSISPELLADYLDGEEEVLDS